MQKLLELMLHICDKHLTKLEQHFYTARKVITQLVRLLHAFHAFLLLVI